MGEGGVLDRKLKSQGLKIGVINLREKTKLRAMWGIYTSDETRPAHLFWNSGWTWRFSIPRSLYLFKTNDLTLSGLTLWNTSPGQGGGRSAHPWIMAIRACFHYFLLARVLSLDVKGRNLKAQLSTSENIALRAFGKTAIFCKIWKK